MSPTSELMVAFRPGISEDEARRIVQAVGGNIRRRMRTDRDDEVMLLVKVDAAELDRADKALSKDESVLRTERNQSNYGII
jgi:hypothetical protein